MSEYVEILVSYLIGTGAGLFLFKRYVQQGIIERTIDKLIEEEYIRSFRGDDGEIHLKKWYDLEDIFEEMKNDDS